MTRAVLLVWIVITTTHVCAQQCRAQQSSPPPTLDELVERVRLADGEAGQNKPANGLYELRCQESGHRMRFQVQEGVMDSPANGTSASIARLMSGSSVACCCLPVAHQAYLSPPDFSL